MKITQVNRVHSNCFSHVCVLKDMHGITYKHMTIHCKSRVVHHRKDLWFLSTKIQAKPLNHMHILKYVLLSLYHESIFTDYTKRSNEASFYYETSPLQ